MRLYPSVPARRARTALADLLVLALVVLFAVLGFVVHDAVDRVAVLGEGVSGAGGAIQGGFDAAADAVDDAPVIGGELAERLEEAGEETGGEVVELGDRGEGAVHRLALVLGLLVFALPTGLVLLRWLPARLAQVRQLTAAEHALSQPAALDRRRMIAMRAAFSLPYGVLLRYTRDPLGDLVAERYDALVDAALDDAGLRRPTS